jgi:alkanesulfonate monooxygenase SsuD/methylene tetrahydromethanopterin reductase-like flavin-dependent oxidoreductase (luciferase family)
MMQGLSGDELTFDGEFYRFHRVPMVLRPVQQPHPPLWYGVVAPENACWPAREGAHMVSLVPTDHARTIIDRFVQEWAGLGKPIEALPFRGVMRLIVLGETEAEASRTAARAYRSWLAHMRYLWDRHGTPFLLNLPSEIGPLREAGAAFVGTASGLRDFISAHVEAIGANYLSCEVAFGDMSFEEALRTTELIGRDVIPAFRDD